PTDDIVSDEATPQPIGRVAEKVRSSTVGVLASLAGDDDPILMGEHVRL
ncbi:MAG: hypothetical protein JJD93_19520, partial [Ilumatobacteraceae bacterium]|nr:hypothetical protein [Ilumatobacteraceae bacterium]